MTDLYTRLTGRRARWALQFGGLVTVGGAGAIALVDNAATRAAAVVVVGLMALAAVKLSLVTLQRLKMQGRVDTVNPKAFAEIREELDAVRAEQAELAESVGPVAADLAHYDGLAGRIEPTIAEFSALKYEVMYLRESIDRLRAADARDSANS